MPRGKTTAGRRTAGARGGKYAAGTRGGKATSAGRASAKDKAMDNNNNNNNKNNQSNLKGGEILESDDVVESPECEGKGGKHNDEGGHGEKREGELESAAAGTVPSAGPFGRGGEKRVRFAEDAAVLGRPAAKRRSCRSKKPGRIGQEAAVEPASTTPETKGTRKGKVAVASDQPEVKDEDNSNDEDEIKDEEDDELRLEDEDNYEAEVKDEVEQQQSVTNAPCSIANAFEDPRLSSRLHQGYKWEIRFGNLHEPSSPGILVKEHEDFIDRYIKQKLRGVAQTRASAELIRNSQVIREWNRIVLIVLFKDAVSGNRRRALAEAERIVAGAADTFLNTFEEDCFMITRSHVWGCMGRNWGACGATVDGE